MGEASSGWTEFILLNPYDTKASLAACENFGFASLIALQKRSQPLTSGYVTPELSDSLEPLTEETFKAESLQTEFPERPHVTKGANKPLEGIP